MQEHQTDIEASNKFLNNKGGSMSREEILKRVNDVFKDIFDDADLIVSDTTTADDVDEWDSLTHITLIATIEEEFDIKFEMAEIISFKNVGEMIDSIEKKLCK